MLLNPILMEMQIQQIRREKLAQCRRYKNLPAEISNSIRDSLPKRKRRYWKMKTILTWLAAALTPLAKAASISMPVNGCTIYKPRLLPYFDGCSEFSAVTGRAACMKVKGICPACVTYQGDHLQMWLPDAVIEVTPHFGRSVFAESASGVALNAHLKAATAWATKTSRQVPLASNGDGMDTSHASFWHVRLLPLPFGKLATTFPPLSASKGVGLPVCYSALSELSPGQWNYGLADLPAAGAMAALAIPGCFSALGAAGVAISQTIASNVASGAGLNESLTANPFPSGCALPVPAKLALAKNMNPSSDAWNLSKLCIGSLGSLLPRTGLIGANDPFKAALIASVKFASVASDYFGDSDIGGWRLTDKWQLVYPPSPHGYCFRPGQVSQALELPFGVTENMTSRVQANVTASSKSGAYIFLVWRLRDTCQEPLNVVSAGAAWQADYQINKAKNLALCSAVQVVP